MTRRRSNPNQMEMFLVSVFPSRVATDKEQSADFTSRLARAMARAAKESGADRIELARRMGDILDQPDFSKRSLDAYISEAKTAHNISLVRFKAFVRATGCNWLWDFAVADDGMIMLEGDEPRLAEIALLEQERDTLTARIKSLKSTPVQLMRRDPRERVAK